MTFDRTASQSSNIRGPLTGRLDSDQGFDFSADVFGNPILNHPTKHCINVIFIFKDSYDLQIRGLMGQLMGQCWLISQQPPIDNKTWMEWAISWDSIRGINHL